MPSRAAFVFLAVLALALGSAAQQQAGSHPAYQQLRDIQLSGETIAVADFEMTRDTGVFHFRSGTFHLLAPVEGKVTGAVFLGDGAFKLNPVLAKERRSLSMLTRERQLEEEFQQVVLRFTDGTERELASAGAAGGEGVDRAASSALADIQQALRRKLRYNLHARILNDVLSPAQGGLFVAFINGKKHSSKMIYYIDPFGAPALVGPPVAPEEIVLVTWDDGKEGTWVASHYAHDYAGGKLKASKQTSPIDMQHHRIDVEIERNGRLTGQAQTTFLSRTDGLRVLMPDLFPSLRVTRVTGVEDDPLDFIQEKKEDDSDFAIILPRPLSKGEQYTITTEYGGTEAVISAGGGNLFPVARHNWYPNNGFGDYATYDLTFRYPRNMTLIATGTPVSSEQERNLTVATFKSFGEQTVAGFNLGRFKSKSKKLDGGFQVEGHANVENPDFIRELQQTLEQIERAGINTATTLSSINTTRLMDKAMAEGELSVNLFRDYFGPTPFDRLAMTQQTATNFGQAWPALVYLPMSSFFDSTVRHQLGMRDPRGYFKSVAAHEVAHQWWGHTVGWASYRDQWISEGFAELSASLFIQLIQRNPREFIRFWQDQLEFLTERNTAGNRAIDVGPVTMGYRLSNARAGFDVTRRLIYPKGGYILHMVRMMMWDPDQGDAAFKALMQDFVRTHTRRNATTEDFKAKLEKHMTPQMDLAGTRTMDWFFDQYVYGTALPEYSLEHSFSQAPDGGSVLSMKITQSGVSDDFTMLVPLYLELNDGRVMRLGSARMKGNHTIEQQLPLGKLPSPPKRAALNYYNDVLGITK